MLAKHGDEYVVQGFCHHLPSNVMDSGAVDPIVTKRKVYFVERWNFGYRAKTENTYRLLVFVVQARCISDVFCWKFRSTQNSPRLKGPVC